VAAPGGTESEETGGGTGTGVAGTTACLRTGSLVEALNAINERTARLTTTTGITASTEAMVFSPRVQRGESQAQTIPISGPMIGSRNVPTVSAATAMISSGPHRPSSCTGRPLPGGGPAGVAGTAVGTAPWSASLPPAA